MRDDIFANIIDQNQGELARWRGADAAGGRAAPATGLFLVYMVNNCPRFKSR